MLEEMPPMEEDSQLSAIEFIIERCASLDLQRRFVMLMNNLLLQQEDTFIQTGTAETQLIPNEVLPCYTMLIFNETDIDKKQSIHICLPVRDGKIVAVEYGEAAPASKYH